MQRTGKRQGSGVGAALVVLGVALTAGCGHSVSVPSVSVPSLSVPSVSIPRLSGIDLSKTDPASAKHAVCTATDVWLSADETTRRLIRPTVETVIAHYRASTDRTTRTLAASAGVLVSTDSMSAEAKRSTWKRLCG